MAYILEFQYHLAATIIYSASHQNVRGLIELRTVLIWTIEGDNIVKNSISFSLENTRMPER